MAGLVAVAPLVYACAPRGPERISPTAIPTSITVKETKYPTATKEQLLKARQEGRWQEFHHPIVEGKETEAIPYLSLPFQSGTVYRVTEGWEYSREETTIHGFVNHKGIDLAAPYGTSVVAPADGYAMTSYHTTWIRTGKEIRTYQGKPIRYGLGNFIQIYIPTINRFVQLGHLSEIDPTIPFSMPVEESGDWQPTNHTLPASEIVKNSAYVPVKKGQPLGRVGYSGLGLGYEDYRAGEKRPLIIDPNQYKSWDEPHVHLEEFYRDQKTGTKGWQRDPYGIYLTAEYYPDTTHNQPFGKEPLFLLNGNLPVFAA